MIDNNGFTRRTFVEAAATAAAAMSLVHIEGVAFAGGSYTPGTYTGVGNGRNGEITVQVTVDESSILAIEVVSHEETPGICDAAFEQVPDAIIAAQGTEVDAAAGATLSSKGIVEAVDDALAQAAGIELAQEERSTSADVIVLGAGAGGLAAASAAAEAGKSVILLEAAGQEGGATLASSGFFLAIEDDRNAALERNDEEVQSYLALDGSAVEGPWADDFAVLQDQVSDYLANGEATGRFDSIECALVDHYLRGAGTDRDGNAVSLDYDNLRASFEANPGILSWLAEDGFGLSDSWVESRSPKGGKISHVLMPEGGSAALVAALLSKAQRLGCDIQYSTRARSLVMQDGRVCGVRATDPKGNEVVYEANSVVVATGAFPSNGGLVSMYQTMGYGLSADCGSTNPPTNVGDGLVMAQRSGAAARDLQFIVTMVRPYHVMGSTADANTVLAAAQLAVNASAQRFANDGVTSSIQGAMVNQQDAVAYLIGDAAMAEAIEAKTAGAVEDYASRGWLFRADTLEEAAIAAGLDPTLLGETVSQFNDVVATGSDEAFGREEFNGTVEQAPFVIAKVQTCYHLTFGGLVIDGCSRVLSGNGEPVEGLFAAGSVLSGFEGVGHQTGDCLNYVVYTGRVAGVNA